MAAMPEVTRSGVQLLLVTNADAAFRQRLSVLAVDFGLTPDSVLFASAVSDA